MSEQNTTHSPIPWSLATPFDRNHVARIYDANGVLVTQIEAPASIGATNADWERQKANARLIVFAVNALPR